MKNCTVKCVLDDDKVCNIYIEGELVLQNIKSVKEIIDQGIKNSKKIRIEVNKLKNIDLSGLQLLQSLKSKENCISFASHSVPEEIALMIKKTGFRGIAL